VTSSAGDALFKAMCLACPTLGYLGGCRETPSSAWWERVIAKFSYDVFL